MAGDWIKMQTCLPDKPEVWQIASIVGIEPDAVIGKLLRVWAWFDAHTENGNAVGVTYSLVDRVAGATGFAEAMALCGWLEQNDINLCLPNFDRHNGKTAKNRAMTNDRVAKSRDKGKQSNDESNANTVTKTVTREEKRREDKNNSAERFDPVASLKDSGVSDSVLGDWLALRKKQNAPVTETALKTIRREAEKAKIPLEDALSLCCSKGWRGFDASWVKPFVSSPAPAAVDPCRGAI